MSRLGSFIENMVAADGGIRKAESVPLKVDAVGRGAGRGKVEKLTVIPKLGGGGLVNQISGSRASRILG